MKKFTFGIMLISIILSGCFLHRSTYEGLIISKQSESEGKYDIVVVSGLSKEKLMEIDNDYTSSLLTPENTKLFHVKESDYKKISIYDSVTVSYSPGEAVPEMFPGEYTADDVKLND